MQQRIKVLEARLGMMESGALQPAAGQGQAGGFGVADLERRMAELEQESAQQNGAIERIQFSMTAVAQRVDEITKDFDLRLNEIEKKLAALESRAPAAATASGTAPAAAPTAETVVPDGLTPDDHYNKAYAYLTATQYKTAETWLSEFVKRHPTHALADNAYYWLGETRLVQNNPAAAVQAFRDGLRAFPKGAKAPDNLFKMGVALEQLKQPQLAKSAWEKLMKDFPGHALAERAMARMAGLKI